MTQLTVRKIVETKIDAQDCIYCGSDNLYIGGHTNNSRTQPTMYFVECVHCKARGPEAPSMEEAVKKWNKETFWDSLSEAELTEPMRHFKD